MRWLETINGLNKFYIKNPFQNKDEEISTYQQTWILELNTQKSETESGILKAGNTQLFVEPYSTFNHSYKFQTYPSFSDVTEQTPIDQVKTNTKTTAAHKHVLGYLFSFSTKVDCMRSHSLS